MLELAGTAEIAIIAFFAGFLPAMIWLAFWLYEDRKRPEPRGVIIIAFITGMIAVAPVLPLQGFAIQNIPMGFGLLLVWAFIEEIMKLVLAYATVLRRHTLDEPIDYPVYLITVALGFSAVENSLFLFSPLQDGQIFQSIITGDLRFLGASLIHILCSGIVGAGFAFAFYRERSQKIWYGSAGVILAIALHATFNLLILQSGVDGLLTVFLGVWVAIIFILLAFEKVKRINRPAWWEKIFVKKTI
jgi:RsiW-degrading membrane proteinase PrsW (M82 family)